MASASPRHVASCLCLLLLVTAAAAQRLPVKSYSYGSFYRDDPSVSSLLFRGAAGVSNGALQVTPDSRNLNNFLSNKSGSVLLPEPFTLWRRLDAAAAAAGNGSSTSTRVVSFNTTFSMNVYYDNESRPGEGLAFVVAPTADGPPPGSHGGFLGLTNATLEATPATNRFVAVEFDTFKEPGGYDPDDNHVGLDVGTVASNKTASLAGFNITIATNKTAPANYTAWIEYDGAARRIAVYMGVRGAPRPATPVLASPLDLSELVPERAYLGFTASTGVSFELNCILDWNLTIETFPADKKSKGWVVPVAVAVPVAAIAAAAFVVARMARARRSMERRRQERLEHTLTNLPGMPKEFAFEKLRKATKNFDERLRLGKGGYGMVYKGVLSAAAVDDDDGRPPAATEVAVKMFTRDDAKCVDDFLKEVQIIHRLRHRNIVPLVGWCHKKGQLLLVYEYMPNGSLDQHIFRRGAVHEQRPALSWESRRDIVADVAAGLHYVHHEYGPMVLHRDIKASNVLLDASFRARLGDFGLARVLDLDRSSFTDLGVAGTRGYIAPEYSVGHKATRQTDVFAFGVLVLEVVTGRHALLGDPACPMLSDWVWRMHGRGALLGAVDQSLGTDGFDAGEATRLLLLGLACSHPNPGDRPTMPEVLQILSGSAPPPEVPQLKPSFVWPPDGGASAHYDLIDIGALTSGSLAAGGSSAAAAATAADDDSARATRDTASAGLRPPNSTGDFFPALSSGR
ncbi:probable L-type lectin-domain containing receptor kinase S.5 [Oryza glaberrima]|uniref:non-specific serine/threonine protein kinase n=1 Tax=Oryza glaberrima TaxID=4538 RepID=I1QK50_ORYGL|nr:probable L-type lectin-domain containing receptor kinase S.5 [Oryza glaberrima]